MLQPHLARGRMAFDTSKQGQNTASKSAPFAGKNTLTSAEELEIANDELIAFNSQLQQKIQKLLERLNETTNAMIGMFNTLPDTNRMPASPNSTSALKLPAAPPKAQLVQGTTKPNAKTTILILANDPQLRDRMRDNLEDDGWEVEFFDVASAVQSMKAGASDFVAKTVGDRALVEYIKCVFARAADKNEQTERCNFSTEHIAGLTPRQRQIMAMVLDGHPSKNIAADLKISQRTVENHRASIMQRTGTKSLPALARLALGAGPFGANRLAQTPNHPIA